MAWKTFKVAGVTFKNKPTDKYTRIEMISHYTAHGSAFGLLREPSNEYDRNAIEVRQYFENGGSIRLGYVEKKKAAKMAPLMDKGWEPNVMFGRKFIDEATGECRGLQLRYEAA